MINVDFTITIEINPTRSILCNQASSQKSVRFGLVLIDEFTMILSDSCVPKDAGPPIGLGARVYSSSSKNKYEHDGRLTVDEFESLRQPQRRNRHKAGNGFHLSPTERTQRLLTSGYSVQDIAHASLLAHHIRMSRVSNAPPRQHQQNAGSAVSGKVEKFQKGVGSKRGKFQHKILGSATRAFKNLVLLQQQV